MAGSRLAATCVRTALAASSVAVLSACAQVTAIQLEPASLTARPGAPDGFVYYMPRPYLLVTALPTASSVVREPTATFPDRSPASQGGGQPPGRQAPQDFQLPPGAEDGGGGGDASKSPPQTTNTSYQASNDLYMLKLIYLPDMSRPMAVRVSSGLFGAASAQLSFQDGWMLTAASGNSDSKAAETLTALAALATSIGKAVVGGAAPGGAPGSGPDRTAAPPSNVLAPGLYAFDYDAGTGRLRSLCRVTGFGPVNAPAAAIPPCAAQLASGVAASIALLTTRSDHLAK